MEKPNSNPSGIQPDALVFHSQAKQNITDLSEVNSYANLGDSLKLYSFEQARKHLGIGRTALKNFINGGVIGVIMQGKRAKISFLELQRFLKENVIREKKQSLPLNFNNRDVNCFINGENNKKERSGAFDSTMIFKNIKENYNNGKYI